MTATRSIFQKICPACMANVSLDTRECSCGHAFDHDGDDASLSSEEIRLQAEELYENYLAARAEQASSAVLTAQAEFKRDPTNQQKSQRVASAIREAEQARAALAEQSARVAAMKKALSKPAPRPVAAPAAPKKPAVLPPPVEVKKKVAVAQPVIKPAPARPAVELAKTPDTGTDNAITTSLLTKRAARKAAARAMKPGPIPAAAAKKPEVIVPPVQTRTPNPAFRQAQAARAEKILRQAETAAAVKAVIKEETVVAPAAKRETAVVPPALAIPPPETTAPDPEPAPALTRSAPRLLGADKKECPNCTASVEIRLNRCRCGYEFPTSETLMPALVMSEEERAEFAKLFTLP